MAGRNQGHCAPDRRHDGPHDGGDGGGLRTGGEQRGDRRRDSAGGVHHLGLGRGGRPLCASQLGAGRLRRGGQEPHLLCEEAKNQSVEAEEGDAAANDGSFAEPDAKILLHARCRRCHCRGRQRTLGGRL